MDLIRVENASFGYTDQPVFERLNFELNKGEVFCLIGPNGCGKTTLLDCILGVKKLHSGKILLENENIDYLKPYEVARKISYIPQIHEKTFPYTVLEIVLMGRAAYTGFFSSPSLQDKFIAEEALETVGLIEYRDRPYTQLSGGESQLVMIARALAQKTKIIIMDEPTSHLDFKHELTVLETIVQLVKNADISILMATHFPNHAFYFENNEVKSKVALMENKNFIDIGKPSAVINEKNLKALYDINAKVVSINMDDSDLMQVIPISKMKYK